MLFLWNKQVISSKLIVRLLVFILNFLCMWGCNSSSDITAVAKDSSTNEIKIVVCDQNYDSQLVRYANDFTPTTIDLNKSLSKDLRSFLLSIDTTCLRKQTKYKYFIAFILEKLSLHYLKCCNQQYDLYQMREGAAAIIINEFNKLAGYESQHLEMLNSGLIMDYIKNDTTLSKISAIEKVMKEIKKEEIRIEKGIF